MTDSTLNLTIMARPSTTVLPRCLQILSRRGYTLTSLRTETADDGGVVMHCTASGPERWHQAVLQLLTRVIDVHSVREVANHE